jgi:hypothetical protein
MKPSWDTGVLPAWTWKLLASTSSMLLLSFCFELL